MCGFNFYSAFGNGQAASELDLDGVENVAEGEDGWLYNLFHKQHMDYVHVEYVYNLIKLGDIWDKRECQPVSGRGSARCVPGNYEYVKVFD